MELAGLGPAPFGAMLLCDMGAEVIRLERPGGTPMGSGEWNLLNRGRPSVAVDLRREGAATLVLDLCESADALIEGFRPGVAERLGVGPEVAMRRNPALVYGRMTGYGQSGPLAAVAGHDINFLALSGALGAMPRLDDGRPVPPLNLVGDMGGGGMLLAFGVVCALLEARASGLGQVVDASMTEGVSLLAMVLHAFRHAPAEFAWSDQPGTNIFDTGSHFYGAWECSDGRFMTTAAVEPHFYSELLRVLGLDPMDTPQWDRRLWPELKLRVAGRFRTRTQAEWIEAFAGIEACVAPMVELPDAAEHEQNSARGSFFKAGEIVQPAPAPRFSRTEPSLPAAPRAPGADTNSALRAWGIAEERLCRLRSAGVID